MAIAFVQKGVAAAGSVVSGVGVSISASGSGHLLVVWVGIFDSGALNTTASSITDNVGNTYIKIPASVSGTAGSAYSEMWYAKNSTAGATTVTISAATNFFQVMAYVFEFSGADTSAPFDVASAAAQNSMPPVSGTLTPSQTGEVLVSGAINPDIVLTGISTSGWISTADNIVEPQASGYLLNASVSSQQAAYSPSSNSDGSGSIAAFKAPTGGFTAAQGSMILVS